MSLEIMMIIKKTDMKERIIMIEMIEMIVVIEENNKKRGNTIMIQIQILESSI